MNLDSLVARLLKALPEGADEPAPAWLLARTLDCTERQVGQLVAAAIDRGELVGSLCGNKAGYFLPTSEDEVRIGTSHIVSRAKASMTRVARLRRSAREKFGESTARLFELEEAS